MLFSFGLAHYKAKISCRTATCNKFHKKLDKIYFDANLSSVNIKIFNQIKKLKPASGFVVDTKREREEALKLGTQMKNMGVISFHVASRETEDGKFKVVAI